MKFSTRAQPPPDTTRPNEANRRGGRYSSPDGPRRPRTGWVPRPGTDPGPDGQDGRPQ